MTLLKLYKMKNIDYIKENFHWSRKSAMVLRNDKLEFSTVSLMFYFQTEQRIIKQANMAKCSRMIIVIFYNVNRKIFSFN